MNPRNPDQPRPAREPPRPLPDGGFDDDFFRRMVADVGVGVGVYDESGTFVYANGALAAILGVDRSAIVGRTLWEVNDAVEPDRFRDYWDSFAVGESRTHEVHYAETDGDEAVPVETVTTAIEYGDEIYHVATVTDASDRIEEWAEMERQDERLSEIASVISHDLRNPLNVAMGRAELAAMDVESEHFEYVERSLRKMEALITDVLTLARKGSRLTDPEPVDVEGAVDAAWYDVGDTDDATIEVVDDLGTVDSGDDRLQELFTELFENAIEHAGEDVSVTVGRLDDGFYVADDGPGVPAEDREEVFDYGYSTTDHGTGFGLTIVEHVAAAHGWTVAMTESEGGGVRLEIRDVDFRE